MKRDTNWAAWLSRSGVVVTALLIGLPALGAEPAASEPAEYRLNAPDQTVELSRVLDEISGLSGSKAPESLWAVHDERATLFRLSARDGSVLEKLPLGKRGDYEGVEEVGEQVFVARSEGVVLVVDPRGGKPATLNFQIALGLACDLEGLAFERGKNRLLLTCKNESSKSRRSNKAFEIYTMALDSRKVEKEPAYVLTEMAIDEYIAAHPDQADLKGSKGKRFAPSGITVHPATGELYILSTRGKMVVVVSPAGELVRAWGLDPAVHPQPEGISFTADGTLFICNEAHGKRARLLRFNPQPAPAPRTDRTPAQDSREG